MRYATITFLLLLIFAGFASPSHAIPICEVSASTPTFTSGQEVPCSMDTSGNMRVLANVSIATASVSFSPNVNIASVGGVVVATPSVPVNLVGGSNTIGAVLQGTTPWVTSLSGGAINATITSGGVIATIATLPGTVNVNCTGCSAAAAVNATVSNTSATPLFATLTGVANVNCTGCSAASAVSATITNTASVTIVGCVNSVCASPGQVTMASSTSVAIASDQTPVKISGAVATNLQVATPTGSNAMIMLDKFGRVVVAPQGDRALATKGRISLSNNVETTLINPAGASTYWDITSLACSNDGATQARVDIREATGGAVTHSMTLAASGGGFVLPFYVPLPQGTANSTWTAQLSTTASVYCNFVAIQNK